MRCCVRGKEIESEKWKKDSHGIILSLFTVLTALLLDYGSSFVTPSQAKKTKHLQCLVVGDLQEWKVTKKGPTTEALFVVCCFRCSFYHCHGNVGNFTVVFYFYVSSHKIAYPTERSFGFLRLVRLLLLHPFD